VTARDDAEQELKLRLPPSAIAAVLRHPAVLAAKRGRMRTAAMHATYYDTADLRLARARIGLRVRREGRRWRQTIKGAPDARSGGGLAARPEYEWPLANGATRVSPPPIDRDRFADTPWRRKLDKAAREGLAPVFATVFERRSVSLVFADGTMATLAVDAGEIRSAGPRRRREALCEIEIELESGRAHHLFDLAHALAADLPLAIETRSKAARGYALVAPIAPAPVPARAVDTPLHRDDAAGDALAAILRSCARQIEANADGLLADDDPEWIHQMRIGTRRLRACLSLLRDLAPAAALDSVADEARWLARALATARDLDVMADATLSAILRAVGPAATEAGALVALRRRVARQRRRARDAAREAVASARFTRLLLATGALAARARFGVDATAPAAAILASPARAFAAPVLSHRQRKLMQRGAILASADAAARHAARLAAKRLRYAAEFFAPLFPQRKARRYVGALEALQDVLGELNDASVAATLAADHAGPDATATATLRGWSAAQAALRAGALDEAWHHFAHARPFWAGD